MDVVCRLGFADSTGSRVCRPRGDTRKGEASFELSLQGPLWPGIGYLGLLLLAFGSAQAALLDIDGSEILLDFIYESAQGNDRWALAGMVNIAEDAMEGPVDSAGLGAGTWRAEKGVGGSEYMTVGLVAYYPFDGNLRDAAKNSGGHDGVAVGAVSFDGGKIGQSLRLTGDGGLSGDGYVQIDLNLP